MSNNITWNENDIAGKSKAFQEFSDSQEAYDGVNKSTALRTDFLDIEPNRSVRSTFTRDDYYAFRVEEQIPRQQKRAIKMCMDAYDKVGIIRNVIDLMGDFGCQGINLVHENKSVEKFYQQWFKKVSGKERSERFLNNLYRTGNVFIYKSYANINDDVKRYIKSLASDIVVEVPDFEKSTIPWRFNFLNPTSIDLKDGNVSIFIGNHNYQLTADSFFDNFIDGDIPIRVLETLPPEVKQAIKEKRKKVDLDPAKLSVFYYKKDDWQQWAHPLVYAILDDIVMLEKMKLADIAALDGAISNIRLWTLGDFDHKILPTKTGINKLRDILASNTGGGTMELVWGPELKFTESNSQVYKFLGSEKYQSVLNSIYAGLGVPPTLTGMASNGGGFTNNFISLKTLVERLQYGRDLLTGFWEKEIENVRRSMGFRKPAHVVYDQMSLSDESSEKNLLIQLADRDIISHETLLERFKSIPQVERLRLQRESKDREEELLPPKSSPYHNPDHSKDLEKIDRQGKIQEKIADKKAPTNPNGRPPMKMDEGPRKTRVAKPKSTPGLASFIAWSHSTYDELSKLSSGYLQHIGKSNLRQLTKAQAKEFEDIKISALLNIEPMTEVTDAVIHQSLLRNSPDYLDFLSKVSDAGLSIKTVNIDDYRREILGLYVEYKLSKIEEN